MDPYYRTNYTSSGQVGWRYKPWNEAEGNSEAETHREIKVKR
jgi:hypothetical protein